MKITVIGTGNVGSVLGTRWAQNGHEVVFGTRDPKSAKIEGLLAKAGSNAQAKATGEAITGADVVVLATPWEATEQVIGALGSLAGKIVIDATNPLKPGLQGLEVGHTTSAGEKVAQWASGARVVKAFNMTGASNMADPTYGAQQADMFICGDDAEAKAVVAGLAEELGFEVVDNGSLTSARYLEPLAMLWIHLAYMQGLGPNFAIKLLRR